MGGGSWCDASYFARSASLKASGKSAFDYDHVTKTSKPPSAWTCHDTLNPNGVIRESCDSDEHPNSVAVAVLFDVTGSMGHIPVVFQQKLPGLMSLILTKGYLTDPHILVAGIGDATCDRVPFQVSQFESDNRIDEQISNLFLEGGGGGQKTESYELGMYFMARRTKLDCYEKRGKRAYCFMLGDEMYYPKVSRKYVQSVLGDNIQEDIPTAEIAKELQQRYETYFIIPTMASHGRDRDVHEAWTKLFSQNVIRLDDEHAVAETIATQIGINEGIVDYEDAIDNLRDVSGANIDAVSKALSEYKGRSLKSNTTGSLVNSGAGIKRL